jgi:hypothetical protein
MRGSLFWRDLVIHYKNVEHLCIMYLSRTLLHILKENACNALLTGSIHVVHIVKHLCIKLSAHLLHIL